MRTWDEIVSDQEVLTGEMRLKVDGDDPDPPDPPDGEVIYVGDDLPKAIADAPAGAILDLGGKLFTCAALKISKPLTMRNGEIDAAPNVNDLLGLYGEDITLQDLTLRGDGTTKRGIAGQAANMVLQRVQIRNIRRDSTESQAMACWDSPGPLLAEDCYFEGGSIGFLAGGSSPTIPNTMLTGATFKRCIFTRPLEWRGKPYAVKNSFEIKAGRNFLLEECEVSNCWAQGQSGYLIQLTPSQYGNSPETTVQNVEFRQCYIHDGAGCVNALGVSQHQNDPGRETLRGGNFKFIECTIHVNTSYDGHGTALTWAWNPNGIEWIDNDVTANGDVMRCSDKMAVDGFIFRGGRVNTTGTYGVWTPQGSRGANWQVIAPGGIVENVTFVNAHNTFKQNFPLNTYETAPVTVSLALSDDVRDTLEDAASEAKLSLAEYITERLGAY